MNEALILEYIKMHGPCKTMLIAQKCITVMTDHDFAEALGALLRCKEVTLANGIVDVR